MKTTTAFTLCLTLAMLSPRKIAAYEESNEESTAVAIDAAGNAYISGLTNGSLEGPNAGTYDAFLTKFDSSGNELWGRQIGSYEIPEPCALALAIMANIGLILRRRGLTR